MSLSVLLTQLYRCAKFELREEVKPLFLMEEISELASDFYTSSEESY